MPFCMSAYTLHAFIALQCDSGGCCVVSDADGQPIQHELVDVLAAASGDAAELKPVMGMGVRVASLLTATHRAASCRDELDAVDL